VLSLSPAKILLVLVVGVIVLGPDKLPRVARQIGAVWGDLRKWRERIETEVRGTFPDLPSTVDVAHAVRSPLSFLDKLADAHERDQSKGEEQAAASPGEPVAEATKAEPRSTGGDKEPGTVARRASRSAGTAGTVRPPPGLWSDVANDPNLN
jgi:Sec-independent protein translocase protein TatA